MHEKGGFMKRGFWKTIGIAACGLAFSVFAAPGPVGNRVVVGVEKVTETEDFETLHYTGQVVSRSVVNIVARVSGEILEVGFKDGGVVRQGQMLYKLDPVQYEAAVKGAEAAVEKSRAELEYAESNFQRLKLLYEKQASSLDMMENAKSALGVAKAALLSAEAELITAKDNLKNTVITASQDGIVGVTAYTTGNYITPNSGTLVTIIQNQPIRVRFSVSVADLFEMFGTHEELMEDGMVELTLADGSVYPEKGEIELLNNEANARTDAIQIYASFPNRERKLVTGNTLSVKLSRRNGKKLASVSPSALMHDAKGSYVYVLDAANQVEKRYVEPGSATPQRQLIESGLSAGEVVVCKGTHKAIPGMTVEPEFQALDEEE